MSHRLLIQQGALLPPLVKRLEEFYECALLPAPGAKRDSFLATSGKGFVAYATNAKFGASAAFVDALPDLKVISSMGVGLDAIDLEAMKKRGIAVGYTPEVLNDCVADIAFSLLTNVARRITAADAFVRRGAWLEGNFPITTRISGKKLGIIGMGRIGSVIAHRATGFDMELRYHNRRPVSGSDLGYMSTPAELAAWADFLVITSAGGPDAQGMISREVLDALGPHGFLINVARGSVVDQPLLIEYLQQKKIAGAGLDVYEREPQVPSELLALDNVVLTPHIASNTAETRAAMSQRVIDNLGNFFAGKGVVSSAL